MSYRAAARAPVSLDVLAALPPERWVSSPSFEHAGRLVRVDGHQVFVWEADGSTYAFIGDLPADRMLRLGALGVGSG